MGPTLACIYNSVKDSRVQLCPVMTRPFNLAEHGHRLLQDASRPVPTAAGPYETGVDPPHQAAPGGVPD